MIKQIRNVLGLANHDPNSGRTIIINSERLERRVALLEDGILEEYNVEREGDDNIRERTPCAARARAPRVPWEPS